MTVDRRSLIAVTIGSAAADILSPCLADAAAAPAQPGLAATRTLARYVSSAAYDALPANVRKEGVRTLLNYVGCAVGGSRHETVDRAVAALAPMSGPGEATVLGRRERFDPLTAALMNGISS